MVESTTVDLPFLAIGAAGEVAVAVKPKVQRDEVEARPDPGDGRDHMGPADGELDPFSDHGKIIHRPTSLMAVEKGIPTRIFSDNSIKYGITFKSSKKMAGRAHVLCEQRQDVRPCL